MRSILVQPEPTVASDGDSAMQVAPFLRVDAVRTPCDDAISDPRLLADTSRVAVTEEPAPLPVQPFVLKSLVMSDQLLEAERAEIEIEHSNLPAR